MINIFLTFLYTGFLAFGGGLVTIPILYQQLVMPGIILEQDFYNMIAISQATPGPIGLNLATYVGFNQGGLLGAILASSAIIIPSIIGVSILARIYEKVKDNKVATRIMKVMRVAITGTVMIAVLKLLKNALFDLPDGYVANTITDYKSFIAYMNYPAIILMLILLIIMRKAKKVSPVWYILFGGAIGIFMF